MNIKIDDRDFKTQLITDTSKRKFSADQSKLYELTPYVVNERDTLTQIAYYRHMRYCKELVKLVYLT